MEKTTQKTKIEERKIKMENSLIFEAWIEDNVNEEDSATFKRFVAGFDLNVTVDRGFDLNKFPDEEDFEDEETHHIVKMMLKTYLPRFY